jgi:alpha-tubulin suppressor-like RCC1 family protein
MFTESAVEQNHRIDSYPPRFRVTDMSIRFSRCSRAVVALPAIVGLSACITSTGPDGSPTGGGHFCLDGCPFSFDPPQVEVSLVPSPVAGGLTFKAISPGWDHVCGVTTAGDAYCWGALDYGPAFHIAKSPERVPGDTKFDTISVGNGAACGIATDRQTMCWGTNDVAGAGNGSYGSSVSVPTAVPSPVNFKSIAVGGHDTGGSGGDVHSSFACGLTAAGTVYCWGTNTLGQLGSGVATTNAPFGSPSPVAGDRTFTALAGIGYATGCALDSSRAAYCWGSNAYAEFGTAAAEAGAFPPTRVASDLSFVALSTGGGTCGVTTAGDTYCWGVAGVVGAVNSSPPIPKLITSIPFVSISAGSEHACGVTASGMAYCWGLNSRGQLGDGTRISTTVPVPVATNLRFSRISAGNEETCALTTDGAAYCWGSDGWYSMLGRGT